MMQQQQHRFQTGADKVIQPYGILMHNFPQSPKGFYSMDIIIIVYNDRERIVSKNSLQSDDNITAAPGVTLRLNLRRVQGNEWYRESELINTRKHRLETSSKSLNG
jgi:hypothetical protein